MPYSRVWVPELGQWKIIGEPDDIYKDIYASNPEAGQINIPASTGIIWITVPGGTPGIPGGSEPIGEIPIAGQIPDLSDPYVITPYEPPVEIWTPTTPPVEVVPWTPTTPPVEVVRWTPTTPPVEAVPWTPSKPSSPTLPAGQVGLFGMSVVAILALAIFAFGTRK